MPSCPAASAKFPSSQAESGREWNTRNPSRQNPVYEQMNHPVSAPPLDGGGSERTESRNEDEKEDPEEGEEVEEIDQKPLPTAAGLEQVS